MAYALQTPTPWANGFIRVGARRPLWARQRGVCNTPLQPTGRRRFFLMVDWDGQANASGKPCFLDSSFLPLMEEKKAKEDQGVRDAGHLWPGSG